MFCGKCGAELREGARFCGLCGTALPEVIQPARKECSYANDAKGGLPLATVSNGSTTAYKLKPAATTMTAQPAVKGAPLKLIPIVVVLAAVFLVFRMCSGEFAPITHSEAGASLIPIAKEYTEQERDDVAKVVGEFMDAVQKQDTSTMKKLCPTDAAVFDLNSYKGYFDALSSPADSVLKKSLCAYSYEIDGVRIEGNQLEYDGKYRVRVALKTYDVEAAEETAGNVKTETYALEYGSYLLEQLDEFDDSNIFDSVREGYNQGKKMSNDAMENYSKALASSLDSQRGAAADHCAYFIVTRCQGGWEVAPVSNDDVFRLFGNWSAAGLATVKNEGNVDPSTLEKMSDKKSDNYPNVVQFAYGEGDSKEGIEVSDVQFLRSSPEDGKGDVGYRITATVTNKTGSSKHAVLCPVVIDGNGGDHVVTSQARSFGLSDSADDAIDFAFSNSESGQNPAVREANYELFSDNGVVTCVSLKPNERRYVDLIVDGNESEWGEKPHPKLAVLASAEDAGADAYASDVGAICLDPDGDVTLSVDYAGYGEAELPGSYNKGAEKYVVRGTITNNTNHTISTSGAYYIAYGESVAPLSAGWDPRPYRSDPVITLAPGESGTVETFAYDDSWLIDRMGLQFFYYRYLDN